jgi:diguanylate cyclase (GGDEF)-like protein
MDQELRTLVAGFERSDLHVALFDPADVLRWANPAYRREFLRDRALPLSFDAVLRLGFAGGFGVRIDSGDIEAFLADILPRRRSQAQRAFETDTVGGRWLMFSETLLPNGWLLTVATDITALKQHERLLSQAHANALHAAQTDALTGVSNRRHALALAAEQFEHHHRIGAAISVAVLDIDFFKRINDSLGHHVGDEVLRAFCAQCKAHLRPGDVFGRLGGEEFVIALPGASAEVARAVVERVRGSLKEGPDELCTFSAGIAEPAPGEGFEATMRRADAALYWAKANGRDQCAVHTAFGMPEFANDSGR